MTQELLAASAEGGDPSGFCLETEAIYVIMEKQCFVVVQMEIYQNDCFRDFPLNFMSSEQQLLSRCI